MTDLSKVSRTDVEDFLFHEAALLDEWRLKEWLELLTPDAEYEIPAPDSPDADCARSLALVFDDRARIEARVRQYLNAEVVPEDPRSRVRRTISNVRVLGVDGPRVNVTANIIVHRFRGERMDVFVGRYDCALVQSTSGFRIRKRRIVLDLTSLRAVGMLTIIL